VLGPIAPGDLGPTLMREHLLCAILVDNPRRLLTLGGRP
jgi:predicted metal-dependent phosphotriesterase family hydrolase